MSEPAKAELAAIATRASVAEAARQAAVQRGDWQAVREYETELSRLHARAQDLEERQRCA